MLGGGGLFKFASERGGIQKGQAGGGPNPGGNYAYPRYKLIFLSFFHGSQDIAQNIEERKVDVRFIAISIVIPAVQLLTQNINKELQRRLWNTVEHLRWNVFAKGSIINV